MTDILHELPDFDEASSSQIPALLQLKNLGYDYIPRNEVNNHRESKSQYILHDIAKKALRDINEDIISDKSIDEALYALEKTKLDDGMVKASEDVYSNLLGGVSVPEIIDGKKTSPQLKFINWQEPEKNVYHVVAEFEIEEDQNRRPDIVLFVNGIPFAVIECKKASVPVDEAVYQMIRNQKFAQTPKFFLFPQILIATNINEIKYGTMQTPFEFYSVWKEKDAPADYETKVLENINKPIDDSTISQVCKDLRRKDYVHHTKESLSAQDLGIYALLSPSRLLDLVRNFIIYDNRIKKITRYQQYFAIKKTLQKIKNFDENGKRRGGLIWHTQGSGKSLTMVMLVKNLIEEVKNPRVIVVTDRTDLDIQIRDTFAACNIKKGVVQATSCKNLLELIEHNPQDVITTLVHKFDKPTDFVDDDNNIFVLIDEAHRTQSGDANMMMNKILPRACQIAFTGTPLIKKVPDRLVGKEMSKSQSIKKFGGLIDEYTISEAEKDGAVLPLIYQGRFVDQKIDEIADKFYERLAGRFSEGERKDFAKKCISSSVLEETSQRIEMIALDVNDHFVKNFQNTGLKGQLVAPSKYAAVMFKQALDLLGEIRAEVIISDTLADEGKDDTLSEHKKIVTDYMAKQKHLYGSLESREKQIIRDYKKNPEGCELLIVVDKLLTGFDAPCDTVLYLAKQLKDHNLLQAIARVNRVYDGADGKQSKTAGLIVDYSKNAKNLKSALELFSHYDSQDIDRALLDTDSQINLLNSIYDRLHATFKDIKDKQNTNDYVEYLKKNEKVREDFYGDVNKFIKQFSVCYSLYDFHSKMDTDKLLEYKKDLKRFIEIKKTTQLSLAEKVDFSKYKDQIMKLLDKYVTAKDVEVLSKEISLSDMREFNQYIEDDKNGLSDKSKADAILAQTKKVIKERYEQDEAFYGKFSELIDKILQELKQAKKEDLAALLAQAKECQKSVTDYEDSDIPKKLRKNKIYHPFYRNIRKFFKSDEKDYSQIVEDIVQIIKAHKIVDFQNNTSVKREIFFAIEDYLFDEVDEKLSADTIEQIVNTVWNLAVQNKDML